MICVHEMEESWCGICKPRTPALEMRIINGREFMFDGDHENGSTYSEAELQALTAPEVDPYQLPDATESHIPSSVRALLDRYSDEWGRTNLEALDPRQGVRIKYLRLWSDFYRSGLTLARWGR